MSDVLPRPDMKHYENEYVQLTDGDIHEVLLEFVREQEKDFNGQKRWTMTFKVHKHRAGAGGAMVSYEEPKVFETSALPFAERANKAASEGQPAFWMNVHYDPSRKRWKLFPSTQDPRVVDERVVNKVVNGGGR